MCAGDHHPSSRTRARVSLRNEVEAIRAVQDEVIGAAEGMGYGEAARFAVRLALEEAIYNAFRHGHRLMPGEAIELSWKVQNDRVTITVADKGPGFDPAQVPDPTADDRLEVPNGRGLLLMRAYMSRVEYNDKGNRVTMVYQRPSN